MSFTQLPVELMLQIMCNRQDIAIIIRLAATNHKMQALWHDNTTSIVCAVFGMTQADFEVTLKLAAIEASVLQADREKVAAYLRQININTSAAKPSALDASVERATIEALRAKDAATNVNDSDVNSTVRRLLVWFQRSADAVMALRNKVDEARTMDESDPKTLLARQMRHAAATRTVSDYWQSYTVIRQFAIGYDRPQFLPAAYDDMHNSSREQVGFLESMSRLCLEQLSRYCSTPLRLDTPRQDFSWWHGTGMKWSHMAQARWRFAWRIIGTENTWCNPLTPMNECFRVSGRLHQDFGHRVALMYGTHETPWGDWPREDEQRR